MDVESVDQTVASNIQLGAQRGLLARRVLDEMGLRELEALIASLRASKGEADRARAERLAEQRADLFAEASAFVDRQARLYASETGRRLRDRILSRQAFASIGDDSS